jgi:hypothetical protein
MATGDVPELYSGGASMFLASMAANGSDKRFEHACETYIPTTTARYMSFLTSQYYIYNVVGLNEDGTQTAYAYLVSRDGQETVTTVENFENPSKIGATVMSGRSIPLYGDRLILSGVLCENNKTYLRNLNKDTNAVDISQLPVKYGYLSGETISIPGDKFTIRMVTNSSFVDYGFKVTSVQHFSEVEAPTASVQSGTIRPNKVSLSANSIAEIYYKIS